MKTQVYGIKMADGSWYTCHSKFNGCQNVVTKKGSLPETTWENYVQCENTIRCFKKECPKYAEGAEIYEISCEFVGERIYIK